MPLLDVEAHILGHGDDRVTSYARKDGSTKGSGDQFLLELEEDVHRPYFLDILPLPAVEPQYLVEALFISLDLGFEAGGVVAGRLGLADAAGGGPDVSVFDHDLDGGETLGIIWPHRAGDNIEEVLVGRPETKEGLSGDDIWSDVE